MQITLCKYNIDNDISSMEEGESDEPPNASRNKTTSKVEHDREAKLIETLHVPTYITRFMSKEDLHAKIRSLEARKNTLRASEKERLGEIKDTIALLRLQITMHALTDSQKKKLFFSNAPPPPLETVSARALPIPDDIVEVIEEHSNISRERSRSRISHWTKGRYNIIGRERSPSLIRHDERPLYKLPDRSRSPAKREYEKSVFIPPPQERDRSPLMENSLLTRQGSRNPVLIGRNKNDMLIGRSNRNHSDDIGFSEEYMLHSDYSPGSKPHSRRRRFRRDRDSNDSEDGYISPNKMKRQSSVYPGIN